MMEFLEMGGHGFYIWGSYGVAALLMIGEAIWVKKKHSASKRALADLEADIVRSKQGDQA